MKTEKKLLQSKKMFLEGKITWMQMEQIILEYEKQWWNQSERGQKICTEFV